MENEFLNLYAAKLVEYGLAVFYMILFVGYWRWVQGAPPPGRDRTPAASHGGRQS